MVQLYFVRLRVAPEPSHPDYWAAAEALLEVCLWAESPEAAAEAARAFARLARWECPEDRPALLVEMLDAKRKLKPWAEEARRTGLTFQIFALRIDDLSLPDFAP